jgi:hypothetical protein
MRFLKTYELFENEADAYDVAKKEIDVFPLHKLLYFINGKAYDDHHSDFLNGIFASMGHYGIQKTKSNWEKMTKAIRDRIQELYSSEIEYEYDGKLYDILTKLPDFAKDWPQ